MKIRNVLIPTDFSKTGTLALEHAAFMARICKANLYILHVIEIAETTYSIYNPAMKIIDLKEIEKFVEQQLNDIAKRLKKEYAITVNVICTRGRATNEIITTIKENNIDIVVMGTHGTSGFNEIFIGSNAHKITTISPCPVITIQTNTKKLGFTNILLPIDDSIHSRQKVDYTITIAKRYAAKIHLLGLLENGENTDPKKFKIKLEAIEKIIKKNGLAYKSKIIKGENLAVEALKYSKKVKADLIVVMSDHESRLTGMFLTPFTKQIVNHSKIPVMSIKPEEGNYDSVSLSAANPF
jgi:nucleotide-binding universal stress UspA family protein